MSRCVIPWVPDVRFAGQTVFCLASGPSMSAAVAESVKRHPRIVVNSTVGVAPSADVLFFTDNSWFETHSDVVAAFGGLVVSSNSHSANAMPDRVNLIRVGWMQKFPPAGSDQVRQGRSSGQTAVSLAIAMGARRVVLLGYDMCCRNGREHHHDDYGGDRDTGIYDRCFRPAFQGWNAQALAAGVTVINATPGSALTEFPFGTLDDLI